MSLNKRVVAEKILLDEFRNVIRPYTPEQSEVVERYKDGTFGVSKLGFSLYSNGHNLRGRSPDRPYGLLFDDGETLFSIGYYRKEYDPIDADGYLFLVAPRGKNNTTKVKSLTREILGNRKIPCKGVYIRFLILDQYVHLLNHGFLPAKEFPWHDDSPEEDETLTSSLLRIDDILTAQDEVRVLDYGSRNSRGKSRMTYNRFRNFLGRNGLRYSIRPYTTEDSKIAKGIVQRHFAILGENEEPIGSTAEDHFNSTDPKLMGLENVNAFLGYLGNFPVSYFAGEKVSDAKFALYTPFTLRSSEVVLPNLGIKNEEQGVGFTAMPIFSYIELLKELRKMGINEVLFGGSEHRNLNRIKRQLGCRNDPSYWAVQVKE